MIRRSDDALRYDCETNGGKKAFGSIPSEMEGERCGHVIRFPDRLENTHKYIQLNKIRNPQKEISGGFLFLEVLYYILNIFCWRKNWIKIFYNFIVF